MKKISFLVFLVIIASSCNYQSNYNYKKVEKEWVYIEIETTMLYDTTDYFYYGQISKNLANKLVKDEAPNGFFQLSNIRYYNSNDLLQVYENDNRKGRMYFRIEDIEYISVLKEDPVYYFEENELHESALIIRMSKRK